MPDILTYPIFIFPSTVENYLRSLRQQIKPLTPAKPKAVFQAPQKVSFFAVNLLKQLRQIINYLFLGLGGLVLWLFIYSLVTENSLSAKDLIFWLFSIFALLSLRWVGLKWLYSLIKAGKEDNNVADDLYWSRVAYANKNSHRAHKIKQRKKIVRRNREHRRKIVAEGKISDRRE